VIFKRVGIFRDEYGTKVDGLRKSLPDEGEISFRDARRSQLQCE